MPLSNPSSEPSNSKSATLSIDFRSGNVVMQLANGEWLEGTLPISSPDRSQINTASCLVHLQRADFERLPVNADLSGNAP